MSWQGNISVQLGSGFFFLLAVLFIGALVWWFLRKRISTEKLGNMLTQSITPSPSYSKN